jgi:hypothetical protein
LISVAFEAGSGEVLLCIILGGPHRTLLMVTK